MSRSESSNWTIAGLGERIARTDVFAGGGAAASMSLVGATATAELVFRLSSGRRKIAEEDVSRLNDAISMCQELRASFLAAIDQDIDSLIELMDAQSAGRKERKSKNGAITAETEERIQRAVAGAIDTPIAVVRDARRLLGAIDDLKQFARTFTASDLGAAAAMIRGAVTSMLIMAEVNLGMIENDEERHALANEIETHLTETNEVEASIVEWTRSVIR